jgi:molybdopterin-guanine dinucleotide biosynthesis protein A
MDDSVRLSVQVTNHASRISPMIDAVLPAGGRISGAFAEEAGAEIKALIRLDGNTLLEQVIGALRETDRVRRIVVVGPGELKEAAAEADRLEPEGDGGIENLLRGLEWLRQANGGIYPDRVLISATDLPFLTSEAVSQFMDACPDQADVCIPAFLRAEVEARFPGSPAEYVRLGQEEWGTGSVFLFNPTVLAANREHIEDAFAARKNPFDMLKLLGPAFITKFLTRRLTVEDIEQRVRKIFGCSGAAIRGCSPELAFDIDVPEEYRYALKAKDS